MRQLGISKDSKVMTLMREQHVFGAVPFFEGFICKELVRLEHLYWKKSILAEKWAGHRGKP